MMGGRVFARAAAVMLSLIAVFACLPSAAYADDLPGNLLYASAAGTWSSEDIGTLHINITGESVSGSYKTGVYSGAISGHTISFSWWEYATSFSSADPEDRGTGSMTLSEDWTRLTGSWKSEKGGYSGSFEAMHISKPMKFDTVLHTEGSIFDQTSGTPSPYAPTSNYFKYDPKHDLWYDINGSIIENAYTFDAWMHAGGFTGNDTEGWYNQGVPVLGFSQLYCAYLKTVGCNAGSSELVLTPAGGIAYAGSSFADFNSHIFDVMTYNATLNTWTAVNDTALNHSTGIEVSSPFRISFPKFMQSMGYKPDKNETYIYVDSQGNMVDPKKAFDKYCLANGCKWSDKNNAWVSPGWECIMNPYDLSNYQLPPGKPVILPGDIVSGMQDIADSAQQLIADKPTQDAFHTTVSDDGWEYYVSEMPAE